jgi:hypothetical protein
MNTGSKKKMILPLTVVSGEIPYVVVSIAVVNPSVKLWVILSIVRIGLS